MTPVLHTLDEVASILGKQPKWVARQVNAGRLTGVRVGKSLRITDQALAAYLDANTTSGPTVPVAGYAGRRRKRAA